MAGAHLSRKQLTEFVQAASLCKRLSVCKQLSMAGECLLCDAAAVSEHNVPREQISPPPKVQYSAGRTLAAPAVRCLLCGKYVCRRLWGVLFLPPVQTFSTLLPSRCRPYFTVVLILGKRETRVWGRGMDMQQSSDYFCLRKVSACPVCAQGWGYLGARENTAVHEQCTRIPALTSASPLCSSIGADTSVQAMAREALSHCGAGQALGSPPHRVFVMASMYLRTSSNLQRRHQIGAQEEARCVGKCGNRGLAVWDYEVPEEAYGVC
eukprot:1149802-Pelagomonas_calceolata.AAC.3